MTERLFQLLKERDTNGREIVAEIAKKYPAGTTIDAPAGRGTARVTVIGPSDHHTEPTRLMVKNCKTGRISTIDGLNKSLVVVTRMTAEVLHYFLQQHPGSRHPKAGEPAVCETIETLCAEGRITPLPSGTCTGPYRRYRAVPREGVCPRCWTDCYRDSADVGVGIIYGPWGCPRCGWSEDERYDLTNGPKFTEQGGSIDQYGGITPSPTKEH